MKTIRDEAKLRAVVAQHDLSSLFTEFARYEHALSLVQFDKGEFLYGEKSDIQHLYFFVEGKLKVCSNLSNGKTYLLRVYTEFEMPGDLELFNRSNPYTTIHAVTKSLCIALALKDTRRLLYQDPVFLRQLAETLCTKLYLSSSNNVLSILSPLENRLARYISVAGSRKTGKIILEENLTELAEQLGTSYRHLQRTLRAFTEASILHKRKHRYEVADEQRLQALVLDDYLVASVHTSVNGPDGGDIVN